VVNPQSSDSLTVANYYTEFRGIPACNVFYLPWPPDQGRTDINTFRQKILLPILQRAMDETRQCGRFDCVAFSTGYPWAVDLNPDLDFWEEKAEEVGKKLGRPKKSMAVGSLTAMTFLWQLVAGRNPGYLKLDSNHYASAWRREGDELLTHAFRSDVKWAPGGKQLASDQDDAGRRYLLCTALGVQAKHGNTPVEIARYLQQSAQADFTHPRGTIYFMKNSDVRSRVRHGSFPAAVKLLAEEGVLGRIMEGKIPRNRPDVQGLVAGTAGFDWRNSGSIIRPGAICEHLTSYGGVLDGRGQTKLTEFLRYGAAGASGTVTEPYAIGAKFPSPMAQVHYARGSTLAEAFYQSVPGPYQLLIVGDPLCRPWGDQPKITLPELSLEEPVSGRLELRPVVKFPEGGKLARLEFHVDGHYRGQFGPNEPIPLDTTLLPDGYHRLRLTAIAEGEQPAWGDQLFDITTRNHGRWVTVTSAPSGELPYEQPVKISVNALEAIGVAAMLNKRLVGRLSGSRGEIEIEPGRLGFGPIRLEVIALGPGGATTNAVAPPVRVVIQPPRG